MEDAPTAPSTQASGTPPASKPASPSSASSAVAAGSARQTGTFTVKRGLADMLRGGVIMDVVTAEHARTEYGVVIDETNKCVDAAATAVMRNRRTQLPLVETT